MAAASALWQRQPLDEDGRPVVLASGGLPPLHAAAARAEAEAVEALLGARADVNAAGGPAGSSPLHLLLQAEAEYSGVLKAATALVSAGADTNAVNREGLRPEDLTDDSGLREAIGATPFLLHDALRRCDLQGLTQVLERVSAGDLPPSLLDAPNNWPGYTPLHVASGAPSTQGTALLLGARASVEPRTKTGQQAPLHLAAWSGSFFVAELLMEAMADVHAREPDQDREDGSKAKGFHQDWKNHFTPLHIAAKGGNVALMRRLLDGRADVDARDSYDRTPLHLCVEGYFDDDLGPGVGVRVQGLRSRPERNGKLAAIVGPLEVDGGCPGCEDPECGRYPVLVEEGPPEGVLLKPLNIVSAYADAVDLLLGARADVNLSNRQTGVGASPLHAAARRGDCHLAEKLIGARAELDLQRADSGFAPLHLAVRGHRLDLIALLLRARANGDLQAGGKTPAQLAALNKVEVDFAACTARLVRTGPPLSRGSEFDRASVFEKVAMHLE